MSANSETDGSQVPHPSYEETDRMAYDSQQEVAEAWADGKFPDHNVYPTGEAVLYSGDPSGNSTTTRLRGFGRRRGGSSGSDSPPSDPDPPQGKGANFYGEQGPDGTGTLWHYNTREAWRTHSGLVIDNQQCWSAGFAHCSTPGDIDAVLPYSALSDLCDEEHRPYDVQRVIGQPEVRESFHGDDTYTTYRPENSVAVFDGYGIAIGYDPTNRDTRYFAMRLEPDEYDDLETADDVGERIHSLLRPEEVEQSDRPVVGAHEYAKSRLDEEELEAHLEAGGRTNESRSRWRDREINNQHFRADLQGNVIVRHGEWFFIPEPDADPEEEGTSDAADRLGNHRAMRFHGARMPYPRECPHCGAQSFDMDDDGETTCTACERDVERKIYVRGQVIHADGDHNSINLGDTWHRAVTHGRNVLTYDDNPATGGGGGGWD